MSETRETPAVPPQSGGGADLGEQIALTVGTPAHGHVVITVAGEIDMLTSPQLRAAVVEQLTTDGVELVVLELDGVTFLGTSGLAVLIEAREEAHRIGAELRLACTARRVLRPLTIAGLVPLFDIHESVDLALAST